MILPTIHLNGTSADMLFEGYEEARQAVIEARTKLEAVEFNSRDYYVQGPGVWNKAVDERRAMYAKLNSVEADLLEIMAHVQTARDERAERNRLRDART